MKPRLLACILFVLFGVAVNVGVAWSCALAVDPHGQTPTLRRGFSAAQDPGWDLLITDRPGTTTVIRRPILRSEARRVDDVAPYWSVTSKPPGLDQITDAATWDAGIDVLGAPTLYEIARGWPMRSLVCYPEITINNNAPTAGIFAVKARSAFVVTTARDSLGMPLLVPLRPILLGFVVNTALYALCLALLAGLFVTLRGRWRRVRGRCYGCGYPIGTSSTCSECGRDL